MASSEKAALVQKAVDAAPAARAWVLKLRQFVLVFGVTALAALAGMILLPQDKYLRYQALNDHVAPHAYWIYERIHADPAPIDIAFIGSSRTGRSIHSARLEADLAQQGVAAKAVNFFMFKSGRNMHYAVAKELLESRRVQLLVLEITEWEDRKPHPDFVFLADPQDVVFAPLFINFNYLSDLGRLPGRQVDLFLETATRDLGVRKPDFVPPPYEGSNLDIAEYLVTLDGRKHYFTQQHSFEHMEELRVRQLGEITPPVLPASLNWLEFRFPRYYIEHILELAARKGTRVVFLYVPRYGGPVDAPPYQQYTAQAGLINPRLGLQQNFRVWDDETHLNWDGAREFTDAVAGQLVAGHYVAATGPGAGPPLQLQPHE
jgi:hypothetical protein